MLLECDFVRLLEPIRQQIDTNPNISEDDIPIIVRSHFPSDVKIQEIAEFLHQRNLNGFSSLTPEKRVDRTKTIIEDALSGAATNYLNLVNQAKEEEMNDELIFSEDEWEGERDWDAEDGY